MPTRTSASAVALAAAVLGAALLGGCPSEQPPARRREPPPEFRRRPVRYAPGERPPAAEPAPAPEPEPEPASAPASAPASRSAADRGLDPDLYSNPIAGIRLHKPKGWHFIPREQEHEDLELQPDNALLRVLLKTAAPAPMVAFAKYPEPAAKLNPSVRVTYRPDPFPAKPLVKLLEEGAVALKAAQHDVKLVGKPAALTIAGHEAAQARVQFTLRAPGVAAPAEARVTVIRKGRGLFSVATIAAVSGPERCEAELAAVLASVQME